MTGSYEFALGVSRILQDYFLVIWPVVLALALAWALSRKVPAMSAVQNTPRPIPTAPDHFALAAFAMFTAFYVFVICYRVNFGDTDHSIYTWSLINHRGISVPIWPSSGRFFPLGHQEFDLLRHLADPLTGFFVLSVLELLALLGAVYLLLDEFRVASRSLILALVLVAPSIYVSFSGLIYSERNLLLLIAVIALCVRRYSRRPSLLTLSVALVATQLALYYKEPVFLFVIGFAGVPVLQSWLAPRDGPRSIRRAIAAHPLETGMLGLGLAFILMYAGVMLPYRSTGYADSVGRSGPLATLVWYLRIDPILIVFYLTLVWRAVHLARNRERLDPFWDALAVGGALYFPAYVALGLQATWYPAPTDLIGILYVGERARRAVAEGRMRAPVPVGLAILVAIPMVASIWYTVVRRKNYVEGRVALAELVRGTADTSSMPLRIFLPRQSSYGIMEFGALLKYRGVRVAAESLATGQPGVVIIQGRQEFPEGRCVAHRSLPCSHADEAASGTLVLTFPDDEPSTRSAVALRPDGVPLFVYEPFMIPRVMPWLKRIRMAQGAKDVSPRTDWLWAYAAVANGESRTAAGKPKAE